MLILVPCFLKVTVMAEDLHHQSYMRLTLINRNVEQFKQWNACTFPYIFHCSISVLDPKAGNFLNLLRINIPVNICVIK